MFGAKITFFTNITKKVQKYLVLLFGLSIFALRITSKTKQMELNCIKQQDCLVFLKSLSDSCVNTIVTSPPYNKGYWSRNRNINNGFHTKSRCIEYENFNDCMEPEAYEAWQRAILDECLRVLKPDGSLFYNHIDILCEHNTIHPSFVYDYPIKQIIIWNRGNTPKLDNTYFFPISEYIFWIKKSVDARPKFYKDKATYKKCIWDFQAERNNNHPAPFPLNLAENCIACTTNQGDLVLDPFMGSGTTALAAVRTKNNYIGCDTSADYVAMAEKRIKDYNRQLSLF
mgnify:CR=1 FL=1